MSRALGNSVPSVAQVVPGAAVSIVLKKDQSTGRQVQGAVQDVLTRGNHPRGIKVRLTDGRIGRVQRMGGGVVAAAVEGVTHQDLAGHAHYDDQERTANANQSHQRRAIAPQKPRYRDIRQDEHPQEPPAEYDLSAFIKTAKPKKSSAGRARSAPESAGAAPVTAKCPVCGDFEGDETAVAHHVEEHFR